MFKVYWLEISHDIHGLIQYTISPQLILNTSHIIIKMSFLLLTKSSSIVSHTHIFFKQWYHIR